MLVTGEMWPSQRVLKDEEGKNVPGETEMENVEHLGQYVYEMTSAKVQQLRAERGLSETALVAAPLEIVAEDFEYLQRGDEDFEEEINEGFEAEEEE